MKQGRLVASAPAAAALASVSARRAPAAAAWPEGPAASGSGGGWRFQERGNGGRDGGDGCCAGPPGVASSESVSSAAAAAARRDGDSDGDRVYVRDEAIGELPSLLATRRQPRLAIIGVGRRNWPCSPGRRGRAGQDHGVCVDGV